MVHTIKPKGIYQVHYAFHYHLGEMGRFCTMKSNCNHNDQDLVFVNMSYFTNQMMCGNEICSLIHVSMNSPIS
jgi:hypothetical protein